MKKHLLRKHPEKLNTNNDAIIISKTTNDFFNTISKSQSAK